MAETETETEAENSQTPAQVLFFFFFEPFILLFLFQSRWNEMDRGERMCLSRLLGLGI